ncbi:FAD-binding dehydrogenase [Vandammella animalimorsus]|uniref:FAD-binding dehydrogenase n=1 Tax=Vandammella animalimorsus TaxID=2029117 RepID=A0A2A2T571_9BURK|nr:FAD-dependent oxidoreductase [Vandammella animalimorsus]PAT32203.1 FAD-binding dehydrogenase [Vandammella animalimorsus]PAX16687.1 FAD-binding dehydrogenase [Vandammella animalimorsus]PAX19317.1 FAD-binding dehydrogenase [Vandammella animalimorsus]
MKDAISPSNWDVIVVGSGAGGMAAAIAAKRHGLSVLLLEKHHQIGGSTALSGGAIWAPLNDHSAQAGHPDDPQAVRQYLDQVVQRAAEPALREAFLQAAPQAMRALQQAGLQLKARTYCPDYYPDLPGAGMGGRTLDPAEFDARQLGQRFNELRDPLAQFMVLGGMMVTLTDAKNLLSATRSWTAFKACLPLLLRYAKDRLQGHHRGTRLVLGNALAGQLFAMLLKHQVDYRLNTKVLKLQRSSGNTRIDHVLAQCDGQVVALHARHGIVLATGGFAWHGALRTEHYPQPSGPYSMAPEQNTGDGITMALASGAAWGRCASGPALWAPVSLWPQADGQVIRYPHLVWDRAKPGLMAVNSAGSRFVNEATSYHEFVRAMYASSEPAIPAYLICDHHFMERWGLGLALPGGRPRQHLIEQGYLYQAPSLAELARMLGLPPAALQASAARFDGYAQSGHDPEFGKGANAYNRYLGDPAQQPNACLGPLRTAPFYAVKVFPGDIGTAQGLAINGHAQVLDTHGRPLQGLYAAGNDACSVFGGEYPAAGITLGPAMTFGWLAAQHMARNHPGPTAA